MKNIKILRIIRKARCIKKDAKKVELKCLVLKRGQKINRLNVQFKNLGEHKISPKNVSGKQIINKRQRIINQKAMIFITSNKKKSRNKETNNQPKINKDYSESTDKMELWRN